MERVTDAYAHHDKADRGKCQIIPGLNFRGNQRLEDDGVNQRINQEKKQEIPLGKSMVVFFEIDYKADGTGNDYH
jgi:hypothetical protein